MPIFTVFRHKVDVWNKTTTENAAGQKKPTWAVGISGEKCHYIPVTAITRTTPTYEETENVYIFMTPNSSVTYGSRLYNLVDRYGTVIEAGPIEIDGIFKEPGFGGKIHHLVIKAKRVIE